MPFAHVIAFHIPYPFKPGTLDALKNDIQDKNDELERLKKNATAVSRAPMTSTQEARDKILKDGPAGTFGGVNTVVEPCVSGPSHCHGFDWALCQLRHGGKVCRSGWNGKGMYVVYQKGYPDGIPINKNTSEATGIPEGTVIKFQPYLMMKTADGSFVPWLASQTDLLAADWDIVPQEQPVQKVENSVPFNTSAPGNYQEAVNFKRPEEPIELRRTSLVDSWFVALGFHCHDEESQRGSSHELHDSGKTVRMLNRHPVVNYRVLVDDTYDGKCFSITAMPGKGVGGKPAYTHTFETDDIIAINADPVTTITRILVAMRERVLEDR